MSGEMDTTAHILELVREANRLARDGGTHRERAVFEQRKRALLEETRCEP